MAFLTWRGSRSDRKVAADVVAKTVLVNLDPVVVNGEQALSIYNDSELPIRDVRVLYRVDLRDQTAREQGILPDGARLLMETDVRDQHPTSVDLATGVLTRRIGSLRKGETRELVIPGANSDVSDKLGDVRVQFLETDPRGRWWELRHDGSIREIPEPKASEGPAIRGWSVQGY